MEWTRFTLFHVVAMVVLGVLTVGGCMCGNHWFELAGAIVGGIVGFLVGFVGVAILDAWSFRFTLKDIERQSNEELWAFVKSGEWKLLHTMSLMQLAARGENVHGELPRVVAMLGSDDVLVRRFGWDALRLVFYAEMKQVEGYNPRDPTEECRAKIKPLEAGCPTLPGWGTDFNAWPR